MAELLRRHWDTAVLLAGRVLGSPDLARDAVQEPAVAAMSDLERLRSPDRFGAWFCGSLASKSSSASSRSADVDRHPPA
jgi:DNA-directed RNA polymerase specialized sigma24 family protein